MIVSFLFKLLVIIGPERRFVFVSSVIFTFCASLQRPVIDVCTCSDRTIASQIPCQIGVVAHFVQIIVRQFLAICVSGRTFYVIGANIDSLFDYVFVNPDIADGSSLRLSGTTEIS